MIFGTEGVKICCFIPADALLKSWCKYRYGVFEETGQMDDHYYPESFLEANQTLPNAGCQINDQNLDKSKSNKIIP